MIAAEEMRRAATIASATTLYHQTCEEVAQAILREQTMKPGAAGVAGGGIYFATTQDLTGHKARRKGVILQAKVRLGRILELDREGDHQMCLSKLRSRGFDSVSINRGHTSGMEYVVYDSEQVLEVKRC